VTNRGQDLVRRVYVIQRLGGSKYSLADLYLFTETQIELTVVKALFENIIEMPLLKARPGDVAQEYRVNSLLNLLCLYVFPVMFSLTASLPVYFAILSIRCTK